MFISRGIHVNLSINLPLKIKNEGEKKKWKQAITTLFLFFSYVLHYRINTSLIGLVAISANPVENSAANIVANGTQTPTIIRTIHNINGNGTVLANMTNSEASSEYSVFMYSCTDCVFEYIHQIHHTRPHVALTSPLFLVFLSMFCCVVPVYWIALHSHVQPTVINQRTLQVPLRSYAIQMLCALMLTQRLYAKKALMNWLNSVAKVKRLPV